MAFLKLTGREESLPAKVAKQGSAVEMIEGSGSPTVQYITAYQMKKLGIEVGDSALGSNIERIHMSDIQNVETVVHLHWLKKNVGGAVDDLIAHTASVKYAETTAVQSGYERLGDLMVTGGSEGPIKELLEFQEQGSLKRRQENDVILTRYGFDRDTVMLWRFNIDYRVRRAQ
jgi:hypothetical protein